MFSFYQARIGLAHILRTSKGSRKSRAKNQRQSTLQKRFATFSESRYPHGLALEPLEHRLNLAPVLASLEANLVPGSATNATSIDYIATFSEPVTGVDPTDFAVVLSGSLGTTLTQIQSVNSSAYKITVSGITGSGALGLNLVADGSIHDALMNPLSDNFTGQSYTIDHVAPYVLSIDRTTPAEPSINATSVSYTVTFSESVTGVDPTDFALVATGTIGTTLTQVQPVSGSVYTVTISGITGNGTLGLNLSDDGTIRDLVNYPLRQANAQASFQPKQDWATPSRPMSVAVADLNGDGKPDLVTANRFPGTVSVLLGNGDGSFQPRQDFETAGGGTSSLAVADVNGDGKPDLLTTNTYNSSASLLLGNGDGTFELWDQFLTGGYPDSIRVADVNADGKPDIVTANRLAGNGTDLPGSVSVLLGNGDGSFQPRQDFATGNETTSVVVADINGDGKPDLVTANFGASSVSLLLDNGDGSFQPKHDFFVGGPRYLATTDVNGDGQLDLIIADRSGVSVTLVLGNGDGTFQQMKYIATGLRGGGELGSLAMADVNRDGNPDIILSQTYTTQIAIVLLGNGNGTFQTRQDFAVGLTPSSLAAADLNGDGKLDLITGNQYGNSVSVLLDNNNGNFTGQIYTIAPAAVVGRYVFYNQSTFDGNNAATDSADDLAIATDKNALLPGAGVGTFANITSFTRGLNGIMVDIQGMHGSLTASDFTFKVGDNNTPSLWAPALEAPSITVRPGAGIAGADRVEFTWSDGAIMNTWLEVTLAANAHTGLAAPDVFYFGNRVGDTGGNPAALAMTNAADSLAIRFHSGANQTVTSLYDIDRNGMVNAADELAARSNPGTLKMLNLPPIVVATAQVAPEIVDSKAANSEPGLVFALALGVKAETGPTVARPVSVEPLAATATQATRQAAMAAIVADERVSFAPIKSEAPAEESHNEDWLALALD